MDTTPRRDRTDSPATNEGYCLRTEPMESAMGGAGDISGGMGGSAGGDIGEMAEAGLLAGVDPRSAIGLPVTKPMTETGDDTERNRKAA